jgi:hypothetical protein
MFLDEIQRHLSTQSLGASADARTGEGSVQVCYINRETPSLFYATPFPASVAGNIPCPER